MTLSCDASGNPVPTTFSWTVNGSAVNVAGRISLSADQKQLTITNLNRLDSGQYRCVATNTVGNVTSNAATLNVQCKSTFTSYLCRTKMVLTESKSLVRGIDEIGSSNCSSETIIHRLNQESFLLY